MHADIFGRKIYAIDTGSVVSWHQRRASAYDQPKDAQKEGDSAGFPYHRNEL